jgi:hypothetical protein
MRKGKDTEPKLELDPDPYLWLLDPDPDQGGPRIRIPNTGFSTVVIADENLQSSLLHSVERGSEGEEEEEGVLENEGSSFEAYEWAGQSRYSVQYFIIIGGISCTQASH